jgi:hypothetical protein
LTENRKNGNIGAKLMETTTLPRQSASVRPARLALSILVVAGAACGGEAPSEEPLEPARQDMPDLYTAMVEGIGQVKPLTGHMAIAVDELGNFAAISGTGATRTLSVIDTTGALLSRQVRLGTDGADPGFVSLVIHEGELFVLTPRDSRIQRYNLDGSKGGRGMVLRDAVRLVGVARDSLTATLGDRLPDGGVRFTGIARISLRTGRSRLVFTPEALPAGVLVAASDSAAFHDFPVVGVAPGRLAVMDHRDGVIHSITWDGAPARTFGAMGGPSTMFVASSKPIGLAFDSANRLWRFSFDAERLIGDVYADGELMGIATKPCYGARAVALQGPYVAVLCGDKGQPPALATPTLFNISG